MARRGLGVLHHDEPQLGLQRERSRLQVGGAAHRAAGRDGVEGRESAAQRGSQGGRHFPDESVERLRAIGAWMRVNGSAIYGSTASPFAAATFRATTQPNRLNLFLTEWSDAVVLPGLRTPVARAYLLADAARTPLVAQPDETGIRITLPAASPRSDLFRARLRIRPPARGHAVMMRSVPWFVALSLPGTLLGQVGAGAAMDQRGDDLAGAEGGAGGGVTSGAGGPRP